jgi:hypothetical protein
MPALARLASAGLSVLSAQHNGTSLGFLAPRMVPQYSVVGRFSTPDCAGTPEAVVAYAVNECFKNSYTPGTYDYECDKDNQCDTYLFQTVDCSGKRTAKGNPIANDGKCHADGKGGYVQATIKTGGAAVKAGFTGPAQVSWHTGDSDCSGAPSMYEDLGLCRASGQNSYRHECSDKKEVRMCQYLNSTACKGFQRCIMLPAYNPTGTCITRKHFGGAASIEYECK